MPAAHTPEIYTAPQGATLLQKLGPGGLITYLLALVSSAALAGMPVLLRLRQVLKASVGGPLSAADAILVLGRKLEKDELTPVFKARLRHASTLWSEGHAPHILITGGITGRAALSEAEAGRRWLLEQGLPSEATFTEDRSQHTLENLFWVREHMRAQGWKTLILVSDPLHLARAQAMAHGLGLTTSVAPASEAPPGRNTLAWWRRALSESFLLHWYHTGVIYSRLIGSRKQLARVT